MRIQDVHNRALSLFADWFQVIDPLLDKTVADFPYDLGVPTKVDNHCQNCVTINGCWFVDEYGKKPIEYDYSLHSEWSANGLYHPYCHCKKIPQAAPDAQDIQLLPLDKFEDFFSRKLGMFKAWGYTENDKAEFIEIVKQKVKESYSQGNYKIFIHDGAGVKVNIFIEIPGKGIKEDRTYPIKSGWTIFPDGTLKANTIMAGRNN